MQRPIAGAQRPDVRHRVRGVVMDAARIVRRLGAFGVSSVSGDHRSRNSDAPSSAASSGEDADRGDTSSRSSAGHAAMAVVHGASPVLAAKPCTTERSAIPGSTWTLHSTEPMARLSTDPLVASLRARQARSMLRGPRRAAHCRRSPRSTPNSLGSAHIWVAIGSRPRCSCYPKDCATGGSTRPIRRTSCVCISKDDWTIGSSGTHLATACGSGRAVFRA